MISLKSKIYVAGHKGLVGSAIVRKLKQRGYKKILYANKSKLDLTNQSKVYNFLKKEKPSFIFIAAAKVGGIYSNNKYPAEFINSNLCIQSNIIHSSYLCGIQNLIFLGSSCVYPRMCKQPIKESYLLSGELEKTNEAYAIAKIAGIKMCESYNLQYKTNYKCIMPTNTFGPNDNYDKLNSHFFPALIRKIFEAKIKNKKQIILWGTGKPKRELLFVDDIAEACIFFMKKKTNHYLINIGSEKERSIKNYAEFISKKLNSNLKIKFDNNKLLDGTPRKVLDCKVAKSYGWKKIISLDDGFKIAYQDFLKKFNYL